MLTVSSQASDLTSLPAQCLRKRPSQWPAMSESEVARHFVALSRLDAVNGMRGFGATLPPQFLTRHPAAPDDTGQGLLACLYEWQEILRAETGMTAVSLAPQTELQSVFACMAMLRAYHDSRGDTARRELLMPTPASAVYAEAAAMCGYTLRKISLDAATLKAVAGPHTAALLLVQKCAADIRTIIQDAGGLLQGCAGVYCAQDMDAISISTPLGDGGTRAWAVGVSKRLAHFLPLPVVAHRKDVCHMLGEKDLPLSIGRLSAAIDCAGALRAYLLARGGGDAAWKSV